MFRNYLTVAIRNIWFDRATSFIHLFGFSIAFAGIILIYLFVSNELGIDEWHKNSKHIYRITFDETSGRPDGRHLATVSPPMGPTMKDLYPEVIESVRFRYTDDVIFEYAGEQFYEKKTWYVDSGFFQMFDFELKYGDPKTALKEPGTVVLSPSVSDKYFGNINPLGETILMNGTTPLNVTGVLKADPDHTHLDFENLISFSTFQVPYGYPVTLDTWDWISFYTYVQLRDDINPEVLESKFPDFVSSHFSGDRAKKTTLRLQPLNKIYFYSSGLVNSHRMRRGNISYVWGLATIAGLILLIACFNFMNLTAARSIRREREVGVRKVLGANRTNIIKQFTGEAVIIAGISLMLATFWVEILKSSLQTLLGWNFPLQFTSYQVLLPVLAIGALLIGVVAGFYPAFVLSKFKTVNILKESIKRGKSGLLVQNSLLTLQFAISIALVAAAFMVRNQLHYLKNQDLGFDQEHTISLQMQSESFNQKFASARQILSQNPNVLHISAGDILDGNYGSVPIYSQEIDEDQTPAMNLLGAHFDYFKTLGIEMYAGREFSSLHPQDSATGIILNETAVKTFGFQDPIGKSLRVSNIKSGQIVGVVKDFHFNSLHDPITPLVVIVPETRMQFILLRIVPGDFAEILSSIRRDWQKIAPDLPFDFAFVDQNIQNKYVADKYFANMVSMFTVLVILVTLLGLFGLISLLLKFRRKEISIRKVLGASVRQLVWLNSKRFVVPIAVGLLIALPISWWTVQNLWLDNFSYRVEVNLWQFILAGVSAALFGVLVLAILARNAAIQQPQKSLQNN